MPLRHEPPSREYMRELKAVASAAAELRSHLRGVNALPNTFPTEEIRLHCDALVLLPEGTAAGSIVTLTAADSELNRIQQNHIPLPPDNDEAPSDELRAMIERGGDIDQRLTKLTSAVRLAIECYKRESGDVIETDTSPEPSAGPDITGERQATIESADIAERKAREARDAFDKVATPGSRRAESVSRTLSDIEAQSRSAKGVLSNPTPRPNVVDRLGKGMDTTANALDALGKGLELGSDVLKEVNNVWSELQRQVFDSVLVATRTVGTGLRNISKIIRAFRKKEFPDVTEAVPEGLDEEKPEALAERLAIANSLSERGRFREAEAEYRAIWNIQRRAHVLGETNPQTLGTRSEMAKQIGHRGRYAEAEAEHRAILSIQERERNSGNHEVGIWNTRSEIASMLGERGQYSEAEKILRHLLDEQNKSDIDRDGQFALVTRHEIARQLGKQRRFAEAEAGLREVYETWRKPEVLGEHHDFTLTARHVLAWLITGQGRHEEAEAELRALLELLGRPERLGAAHPHVLRLKQVLAKVLDAQGKHAEAAALLDGLREAMEVELSPSHNWLRELDAYLVERAKPAAPEAPE